MSTNEPSSAVIPALCIATCSALVGLADWPYGYFVVLRFVLAGISLFLLLGARLVLVDWERWLLGALAVLYNPVLPVRIGEKEIWVALNVATVALFWFLGTRHVRERRLSQQKEVEARAEAKAYADAHAAEDKAYADEYAAALAAGGTPRDAHLAARKAIGKK